MALSNYTGAARNIHGGLSAIGFVGTLPDRLKWLEKDGDFIDWAKTVQSSIGASNRVFSTVDGLTKAYKAYKSGATAANVAKAFNSGQGWLSTGYMGAGVLSPGIYNAATATGTTVGADMANVGAEVEATTGVNAGINALKKALPWLGLGLPALDMAQNGTSGGNISAMGGSLMSLAGAGPAAFIPAAAFTAFEFAVGSKHDAFKDFNDNRYKKAKALKTSQGQYVITLGDDYDAQLLYDPNTNLFYNRDTDHMSAGEAHDKGYMTDEQWQQWQENDVMGGAGNPVNHRDVWTPARVTKHNGHLWVEINRGKKSPTYVPIEGVVDKLQNAGMTDIDFGSQQYLDRSVDYKDAVLSNKLAMDDSMEVPLPDDLHKYYTEGAVPKTQRYTQEDINNAAQAGFDITSNPDGGGEYNLGGGGAYQLQLNNNSPDIEESLDDNSLESGDENKTDNPLYNALKDTIGSKTTVSNPSTTISLADYNKQWTEAPSITNNWIGTHVDGTREKINPGTPPPVAGEQRNNVASTGVPSLGASGGTGIMPTTENANQPSLIEQLESALGITPGSFAQYASLYNDELSDSIKQLGKVSKQTIPFQGMNLIPKGAQEIALNRLGGLAALPNPNKYSADLAVRTALGNQDYQHNVDLAKLKHGYDLESARIAASSRGGSTSDLAARQALLDSEYQHKMEYLDKQHQYSLEQLAAQQASQSDDSSGSDFWKYVAAGGSILDWLAQNPIVRGVYNGIAGGDDEGEDTTAAYQPSPSYVPTYDNTFMDNIDPYPSDTYAGIGTGWTSDNPVANPFEDVKPWLDYQPVYTPSYNYDFSYNGSGNENFWNF